METLLLIQQIFSGRKSPKAISVTQASGPFSFVSQNANTMLSINLNLFVFFSVHDLPILSLLSGCHKCSPSKSSVAPQISHFLPQTCPVSPKQSGTPTHLLQVRRRTCLRNTCLAGSRMRTGKDGESSALIKLVGALSLHPPTQTHTLAVKNEAKCKISNSH